MIIQDVDFIFTPGGAEDGAYTAGTPATLKVDEVSVEEMEELIDRSTAQDQTPMNRSRKTDWTISVTTKLRRDESNTTLFGILKDNALVGFTMSERSAAAGTFGLIATNGIVQNFRAVWNGDNCNLSFTLKPYGTALTPSISA